MGSPTLTTADLAMAAVARWLGDEIRAGRAVPSEPER